MRKSFVSVIFLLALLLVVSGCTQPDVPDNALPDSSGDNQPPVSDVVQPDIPDDIDEPLSDAGSEVPKENPKGEVKELASIEVIAYPESIESGAEMNFGWIITPVVESKAVSHTSIHYGLVSVASVSENTGDSQVAYTEETPDFSQGNFNVPKGFTSKVAAPSEAGVFYARAHAVIDGKHLWSNEFEIEVTPLVLP